MGPSLQTLLLMGSLQSPSAQSLLPPALFWTLCSSLSRSIFPLLDVSLDKGYLVRLGWLVLMCINYTNNATFPYLPSLPEKKFALFACSRGDARFAESSICEFAFWKHLYTTTIKTVTEFLRGEHFKVFSSLNQVISDLTVSGKTLYHIKEPFWKASSKKMACHTVWLPWIIPRLRLTWTSWVESRNHLGAKAGSCEAGPQ